jgi:ribonuclease-3
MSGTEAELEERLGYRFSRPELLDRALTHSSAVPELRAGLSAETAASNDGEHDNEQLEFLGDAVLDMLVNARALEIAARRLNLGEHLRLGRGEEKSGGREKAALLADAFEAVIAAIYLDGGLAAAREALRRLLFIDALRETGDRISESDRKSALQEFLQGRGQPPAEYRLAGETGPDHQKMFQIEVWVNGFLMSKGEGSTKKEAEQRAARSALERLEQRATGV